MNLRETYEQVLQDARVENTLEAMLQAENHTEERWLSEKIAKRAAEIGLSYNKARAEVAISYLAAAMVSKDPIRQNLSEKTQAQYINTALNDSRMVEILPKNNDIRFEHDGHKTRSVDAIVNGCWFATMKLITGQGGAQDNQRAEVKDYIRTAVRQEAEKDVPHFIMAIVDDDLPRPREWYLKDVPEDMKDYVFFGSSEDVIEFFKRG